MPPRVTPTPAAPMAYLPPVTPNVPNAGAGNGLAASNYNLDAYVGNGGDLSALGLGNGSYNPPPPTGAPTTMPVAPTLPESDPRDDLVASLKKLLMPSDEESKALSELDALDASYRTGNQNIQDKTIAMDFITGQQQSLENRYLNNRETLEQKAARTQAKRQIALDATKFALDREDKKIADAKAEMKPIEVGGNLVKKNADGSYSTVFSAPAKASDLKTQVVDVDGRKVLIDSTTGQLISDLGSSADANKPMSGDQAKVYAIATTITPEIQKLKDAFKDDYSYRWALAGIRAGTNRELVKLIDQVADKVGRLRSGGAINTDEEARFKRQIVSGKDLFFANAQEARNALDGILAEANSVAQNIRPATGGLVDVSQATW